MNLTSLILTLHIALLCIGTAVLARPSRGSRHRGTGSPGEPKRTRSGRRLRMLQKILKSLTPDDVLQLARSKKDRHRLDYGHSYIDQSETLQVHPPKIECPPASDGHQLFACPSPNLEGYYPCIDDHSLCNDKVDCPRGEDENRTVCMFHKTTMKYFKYFSDFALALEKSYGR